MMEGITCSHLKMKNIASAMPPATNIMAAAANNNSSNAPPFATIPPTMNIMAAAQRHPTTNIPNNTHTKKENIAILILAMEKSATLTHTTKVDYVELMKNIKKLWKKLSITYQTHLNNIFLSLC